MNQQDITSPSSVNPDAQDWLFGPDENPVLVRAAESLMPYLPLFLGGWPLRRLRNAVDAPADLVPDIDVSPRPNDGFVLTVSHAMDGAEPESAYFDNPLDAANGLAGDLIGCYVAARPSTICLHSGAARIGAGLVVMLGASLSGKSSLSVQLAAASMRFFGDDQVAVRLAGEGDGGRDTHPHGICLGLMPKVRLPLPAESGPQFARFVADNTAYESEAIAYLQPPEGEAASFEESAPLTALIVLRRQDIPGPTILEPARRAAVMQSMIVNAFAPHLAPDTLLAGLRALADEVPAYRLSYYDSRDAADRLIAEFGTKRPSVRNDAAHE